MKKILPSIFSLLFSSFSALLTESSLFCLSAVFSPFYNVDRDIFILAGIMILCVLALVLIFIANLKLIFKHESVKRTVITEILVFAISFLPFWYLCDIAFNTIF